MNSPDLIITLAGDDQLSPVLNEAASAFFTFSSTVNEGLEPLNSRFEELTSQVENIGALQAAFGVFTGEAVAQASELQASLDTLETKLGQTLPKALEAFKNSWLATWDELLEEVKGKEIPELLHALGTELPEELGAAGARSAQAFWTQFAASFQSGFGILAALLEEVRGYFPQSPPRHGPLKDIMEWGPHFWETLGASFQVGFPAFENQLERLLSRMSGPSAPPFQPSPPAPVSGPVSSSHMEINVSGLLIDDLALRKVSRLLGPYLFNDHKKGRFSE